MKNVILCLFLYLMLPFATWSQCTPYFDEGFESGSYAPSWAAGTGLDTAYVSTISPSSGTHRLHVVGGDTTAMTGLHTTFPAIQPQEISWDVNAGGASRSCNIVIGNAAATPTNCIIAGYYQNGSYFFTAPNAQVSLTGCSTETWFHFAIKDIDWVHHHFDFYIDGYLFWTDFPFKNNSQDDLSQIHLYNLHDGISYWDNVQVRYMPSVTSTVTQPSCYGMADGQIVLTPNQGNPNYTYLWSNGMTTPTVSGLGFGPLNATVTDSAGCAITMNFWVMDPPALADTATLHPDNGQGNGSINLTVSGGTPGYSYAWSNGATTQDITGLGVGTYTVTITDNNGCSLTDTFDIIFMVGLPDQKAIQVTFGPNPFAEQFEVKIEGTSTEALELSLCDLAGKTLWHITVVGEKSILVAPQVPAGAYILNVGQGEQKKMLKVLKQ
jgi:hypothetical protein